MSKTRQVSMSKKSNTPTEQGAYKVGNKRPPVERQFGQPNGNPRNPGGWKKKDTARYKLEQMMKLTQGELLEIVRDPSRPYFEQKLAQAINKGDWKVIEGMMNQVYGAPKSTVEAAVTFPKPLVDLTKRNKNGENK